ncbi:hypothetical protein IIE18_10565 [Pseudomonas sp. V1]|uniref:hypothetical protein n=1 Tax=Pseudomonas arcuscaelestis TaxID=2710591 RepID=UPI00193F9F22|nr:hypothetical protein [Pseudomonas arcuscaelestis]MBM3105582.1 hypothetical protein [Pseudomonas arcuscaelestis]
MPTKTTGAELKAFYSDDEFWNPNGADDVWQEELELEVNGVVKDDSFSIEMDLKPEDQVRIMAGWVQSTDGSVDLSFETYFKRWKKQQDTAYLSVQAPKDKLDAIRAAIIAAGGKVA